MTMTRVFVTGLGATSPVGGDASSTWDALLEGRSGVRSIEQEWAQQLGTTIAAEVAVDPSEVLDRVKARRLDRSAQLALVAALEAWADSGLAGDDTEKPGVESERLGVAMASGIGGVQTLLTNYDNLNLKGPRRVSPLAIPMLMPNSPAANIGLAIRAQAGVHTPVSACASGNEAIALGIDMIRLGRADVVVVGGTEAAVHPLPMAAFGQMMALSKRNDDPEAASRPWDKGRDGFVLGEGAAALVLESEEHARARGAKVYAEAAGAGITADSHDIAQPDPVGRGATRASTPAQKRPSKGATAVNPSRGAAAAGTPDDAAATLDTAAAATPDAAAGAPHTAHTAAGPPHAAAAGTPDAAAPGAERSASSARIRRAR
jgi:3-oxoacyl-[acyl-carrier-protein] synthase II